MRTEGGEDTGIWLKRGGEGRSSTWEELDLQGQGPHGGMKSSCVVAMFVEEFMTNITSTEWTLSIWPIKCLDRNHCWTPIGQSLRRCALT
ncbi:hypothetical protein ZWY2020_007922 [Hordeum vulgare]|nr:hypothetical protein ZWY2020_007922 [Hordeum vulgare]